MSSWEIQGNRSEKEAELVVEVINLSGGYELEKLKLNPQYQRLLQVTNTVCNQLRDYQTNKVSNKCPYNTSNKLYMPRFQDSEYESLCESADF